MNLRPQGSLTEGDAVLAFGVLAITKDGRTGRSWQALVRDGERFKVVMTNGEDLIHEDELEACCEADAIEHLRRTLSLAEQDQCVQGFETRVVVVEVQGASEKAIRGAASIVGLPLEFR